MKKLKLFSLLLILSATFFGCSGDDDSDKEEDVVVNEFSIVPSSTDGIPNDIQGCIEINQREVLIEVWDHATIDGDIVSVIANGEKIINQQTLDGPNNKISVNYTFGYNGFNYLTLRAHNYGDLWPNTAAISINGVEFVSEQYLEANAAFDIVVIGYGVTCDDAQSGGGGDDDGGGDNNPPNSGDISFWTASDLGCGNITVSLHGIGSGTLTQYITSGTPVCGQSGTLNFSDVPYGSYNFSASCSDYSWSGSITLSGSCYTMQLTL